MFRVSLVSSVVPLLLAAFLLCLYLPTSSLVSAQLVVDDAYCRTLHADFLRRQVDEWQSVTPYTVDDGTKHTPFLTYDAASNTATVIVGNGNETGGVFHPMEASEDPSRVHFIMQMYVVDQNARVIASQTMDPTLPAPARMIIEDIPPGVTALTAYEFCNLHGLWQGPTVSITTTDDNNNTGTETATSDGIVCAVSSPSEPAYDSYAADFVRRQTLPPFNTVEPYTADRGTLHVPYITVDGTTTKKATVVVGTDEERHEMRAGTNPHWINAVYVVDQDDTIVVVESLDPTMMEHAEIRFDIPDTATTLQAYSWCNIHGLYVGPKVSVATGEVITEKEDSAESNPQSSATRFTPQTMEAYWLVAATTTSSLGTLFALY